MRRYINHTSGKNEKKKGEGRRKENRDDRDTEGEKHLVKGKKRERKQTQKTGEDRINISNSKQERAQRGIKERTIQGQKH